MKHLHVYLLILVAVSIAGCKKDISGSGKSNTPSPEAIRSSGKGSGSGSGGGGGSTTGGFLQGVLSGLASRHISGNNDSVLVTFTQQTPPGWVLNASSSNPAVQVPATFAVPPGVFGVYLPFTSTAVTNSINVTITVKLFSETKSTTIKVFARTATFPAPVLQSPSNGAGFKSRTIITFTSNTNNNAYYYHLQIANNSGFINPETELLLNDPLWRQSAFDGLGTHYWRMRFVDASGNGGPWSEVRTFVIKSQ